MWRTTGWLAKHFGVSRTTVRNWIESNEFEQVSRTTGNHYRVWLTSEREVVGYCRVSSAKQKSSLDRQRELILQSYPSARIVSDIASGFNFKRRGLVSVLEQALSRTPVFIVVTTQDRLARTGLGLIRWIVESSGGSIECLEKTSEPEGFDVETLIGFVTSFCASEHGKRGNRRKKS